VTGVQTCALPISNCGANKSLPIDIPIRYFYDSDITGKNKSMEHLNKGDTVFLWSKFLQENNIPFKDKWDLNDIIIYNKKNKIKTQNFEQYFSNDPMDLIDI
jgi:hypothetical protein